MKKGKPAAEPLPIDYSGIVALCGAAISFCAFLFFYRRGEILLYGDAVAHLNIARRIFDCREPGIRQLGTVWLPLPHLLMVPFLLSDNFWVSGIGGSLPSMVAFVVGAIGLYRLIAARVSHPVGGLAAAIYLLNPNLLYMQATAMGETVYLALMIWAIVYLDAFAQALQSPDTTSRIKLSAPAALSRCTLVLCGAMLTRYDGWFLAAVCGVAALALIVRHWKNLSPKAQRSLRAVTIQCLLLGALVPTLWLSYNYLLSGHPMDFANGPYSAKAITARTTPKGAAPYPGKDHPATAALYFLKAAKLDMAEGYWQPILLAAVLLGSLAIFQALRTAWVWLLLWTPVAFYALSIAYGSVPIFLPEWWPFSYYNVRYGLELIPVFAVSLAVLAWKGSALAIPARWKIAAPIAVIAVISGGYVWSWRATPICLREARANGKARLSLDTTVARYIARMPENATILMQTGAYVGALELADRHLDHVIWEGVFWQWEGALNEPAKAADYVIAYDDDLVSQAAHRWPYGLQSMVVLRVEGQPSATLYRSVERNAPPL
jgi:hypothetical protein